MASALYVAYLLVLMTKAYSELRAMPFFGTLISVLKIINKNWLSLIFDLDMRLKFLTLLVLFVLGISISVTLFRFGVGKN